MSAHHIALLVTGALLAVLSGLGLSLQLGWRRAAPRAAHHLLFFAVCAGVVAGGALASRAGERGWALLPALALLLRMPRTRPGRANHWRLALIGAVAYALGAWAAW
ncbi:hypothetical protein GCM10010840_10350 [Deinococcus aerolatus]|uniref:Uncharacterized protein n=1 Tax=Deinococcus aerolatus TaxID=522487 RepID=A0ABQ2G475_9DEIO|nr:hypothetical protein [Deinococcus aerolatus]GGL74167.1 hypothetical protein GCM10010840_10350 [Deinococcus aerolatus]